MKIPIYILAAVISLDGKIARYKNQPSNWSSPEDKKHLKKILKKCDVIIVGNNTYKISNKPLSKRNCIVLSRKIKDIKIKNKKCVYINPQKYNIKKYIKNKKYKNICVLGGVQVYDWALKNKMVDEVYLTIEPAIFGRGINFIENGLKKPIKFKLDNIKKLNLSGSLLLKLNF